MLDNKRKTKDTFTVSVNSIYDACYLSASAEPHEINCLLTFINHRDFFRDILKRLEQQGESKLWATQQDLMTPMGGKVTIGKKVSLARTAMDPQRRPR